MEKSVRSRAKLWNTVKARDKCEARHVIPTNIHDINLSIPVPVRNKRDPLTIRRHGKISIVPFWLGQLYKVITVRAYAINLTIK